MRIKNHSYSKIIFHEWPQFDQVFHVDDVMKNYPAKDNEIWEYAQKHQLIIATNDENFLSTMTLFTSVCPSHPGSLAYPAFTKGGCGGSQGLVLSGLLVSQFCVLLK